MLPRVLVETRHYLAFEFWKCVQRDQKSTVKKNYLFKIQNETYAKLDFMEYTIFVLYEKAISSSSMSSNMCGIQSFKFIFTCNKYGCVPPKFVKILG